MADLVGGRETRKERKKNFLANMHGMKLHANLLAV